MNLLPALLNFTALAKLLNNFTTHKLMNISDLPQPYRALAELRKQQDTASVYAAFSEEKRLMLNYAFQWSKTIECNFWYDVYLGKLPPIPQSSLDELARLNLWPVATRLPYDEKPLPVGIEAPPDGWCYVGKGAKNKGGMIWFSKHTVRWVDDSKMCDGGNPDHHYAAPSNLCNRLQPSKPAEPFTSIRLPDITPVFTRTEPHAVESYRAAIIAALESADNSHGASLVKFYPVVKTIN